MALINTREDYSRYSRYFVQLKQIYKEKPEVRASLEILLTILTISFFIVFAIRPTANTIASLFSNINSQKDIQQILNQKISDLSAARQIWNKEQARLPLIDDALPTTSSPDSYLRQIEGLSTTHNVSLLTYTTEQITLYGKKPKLVLDLESQSPKANTSSLSKTRIAFTISGQFNELLSFMDNINGMRKVIQLDTLSLSPNSSGAKITGGISLKVTGYTPYYETLKK